LFKAFSAPRDRRFFFRTIVAGFGQGPDAGIGENVQFKLDGSVPENDPAWKGDSDGMD
jgi:hypothetical protein